MKKRFLSLILIATMSISMIACQKKTENQPLDKDKFKTVKKDDKVQGKKEDLKAMEV